MNAPVRYTLFDTAIGRCAIAWRDERIVCIRLPGRDEAQTTNALLSRFPHATQCESDECAIDAMARIVALLEGGRDDLQSIAVDLESAPAFHRRVYEVARKIPPGQTRTYGEIAAMLDEKGAARAVGAALGANPVAIIVPCHRVLAAGGRAGGFTAPGGVDIKMRMLAIERARIGVAPGLFDGDPDFVLARRRF